MIVNGFAGIYHFCVRNFDFLCKTFSVFIRRKF